MGLPVEAFIDFSANINPLGMPVTALAALQEGIRHLQHYPESYAESLVEEIAATIGLPSAAVLAGNGSTELIYLLVRVLQPARTLIVAPAFTEYQRSVAVHGGTVKFFYTDSRDDFALQPERLREALLSSPDLLFIGNPNNPTGAYLPVADMRPIVETARDQGVVCVIDEAFVDFVDNSVSADQLVQEFDNLIILRSLTKIFSLAGLRCGYLLACPDLVTRLRCHQEPWNVNSLAVAAAKAALADEPFRQRTRRLIDKERSYLTRQLATLAFFHPFPSTTNYLLIRVDPHIKTQALADFLLHNHHLLVRTCNDFAGLDDTFIRVAVKNRADNEVLVQGCEEFAARQKT
ncbi:MAG: threonine-phosphate decarboxylase [Deltaproteobacteria bacterium]|nr:threonine-phosphate decarboxylase [Candidatus Anaeroferrophillus wilburensis]MBN2889181.1 threonine-phosphate decarboxylase [Deltaproteobacteria bacterium]